MTMQYFKDANDAVHGFDDTDPAQVALMNSLAIDQEWVDVTSSWPPAPTLAQTQTGQIAVLSAACQSAITTGFTSKALGPSYNYGSQLTDQNNLLSALSAAQGQPSAWTTPLWCANGGAWAFQPHSAAQVAQVNTDWVAFRTGLQQKYAALVVEVQAATSVAAVEAIVWQ